MGEEDRGQGPGAGGQGTADSGQGTEDGGQGPGARGQGSTNELRDVIREIFQEFVGAQKSTESLERRVDELIAENQKTRAAAEEAQRSGAIRTELQKLGVAKVELDPVFGGHLAEYRMSTARFFRFQPACCLAHRFESALR